MKPFELAKSLQFYGSIVLRIPAEPVKEITSQTRLLIEEMSRLMTAFGAVGLAANQVGIIKRIIVIDWGVLSPKGANVKAMINPEIVQLSDEKELDMEGCLSLPGIGRKVSRSKNIKVKYLDETGTQQILDITGLKARVVQHEVDHLNGILIIDKVMGPD